MIPACNGIPALVKRRSWWRLAIVNVVNTDRAGEPGKHWLGLWTDHGVCEVMDSYGLPLTVYDAPGLHEWIAKHWKYVVRSDRTLQAYDSRACGHYVFAYLQDRVRGRTLLEFVESFRDGDYVWNDHCVRQRVRDWIQAKLDEVAMHEEPDGRPDSQRCVSRRFSRAWLGPCTRARKPPWWRPC